MTPDVSERGLILAPQGRDAAVAASMLQEASVRTEVVRDLSALIHELAKGAGFAIVTEEALTGQPLHAVSSWIAENVSQVCRSVAVRSSTMRLARNGGRKSRPIKCG